MWITKGGDQQGNKIHKNMIHILTRACLVYIMGAAPGGRVLISRIGAGVKTLKIFYICMCVMIMSVWTVPLPRNLSTSTLKRMLIRCNPTPQALSSWPKGDGLKFLGDTRRLSG